MFNTNLPWKRFFFSPPRGSNLYCTEMITKGRAALITQQEWESSLSALVNRCESSTLETKIRRKHFYVCWSEARAAWQHCCWLQALVSLPLSTSFSLFLAGCSIFNFNLNLDFDSTISPPQFGQTRQSMSVVLGGTMTKKQHWRIFFWWSDCRQWSKMFPFFVFFFSVTVINRTIGQWCITILLNC